MTAPAPRPLPTPLELEEARDADLVALYRRIEEEARQRRMCLACGTRHTDYHCHCENDE